MSAPEIILLAIVLAVGLPSAWRNPTAGALVLCWIFSKVLYLLTGDGLATEYFIFPDIFVIAVIFAKQDICGDIPYDGAYQQLKCMFMERAPSDRFILCTYPLAWALYAAPIDAYYIYWGLWFIAVAQFLAAGAYLLAKPFYRDADAVIRPPDFPGSLLVALGGRGGWSRA